MSDIKAGDLVMVVRWPCCGHGLGAIFQVKSVFTYPRGARPICVRCWTVHDHEPVADALYPFHLAPISWLKKIDPPAESERAEHREEIAA